MLAPHTRIGQRTIPYSSGLFNFSADPAELSTRYFSEVVTIVATSYGLTIGSSGVRIWDTTLLPAQSTQTIVTGTPLRLPFIDTQLPAQPFDAIVAVTITSARFPQPQQLIYAFSNSSDNYVIPAIPPLRRFWTDLFCFGSNDTVGDPGIDAMYMFGGTATSVSTAVPQLYFSEPTTTPQTISTTIAWVLDADSSQGIAVTLETAVPVGSTQVPLGANLRELFGLPPVLDYFIVSAVSTDIEWQSLLPYYHWGCLPNPVQILKPVISIRADRNWALEGAPITWTIRVRYSTADRQAAIAAGNNPVTSSEPIPVDFFIYESRTPTDEAFYGQYTFMVPVSGEVSFTLNAPIFTAPTSVTFETFSTTPNPVGYFNVDIIDSVNYDVVGTPAYVETFRSPYNLTVYDHTRYIYQDLVRVSYYLTGSSGNFGGSSRPEWYNYEFATFNGGISTASNSNPDILGRSTPNNIRRFNETFTYREFAARIITPIYAKRTATITPPTWVSSDRAAAMELATYRYLTGLTTAPDGTPCPDTYVLPYVLGTQSNVLGASNELGGYAYSGLGTIDLYPDASDPSRSWIYLLDRPPTGSNFYPTLPIAPQEYNTYIIAMQTVTPAVPIAPSLSDIWSEVANLFDPNPS